MTDALLELSPTLFQLQSSGLLPEFDVGTLVRQATRAFERPIAGLTEPEVIELLFQFYGDRVVGVGANRYAARDRVIFFRESHALEGDEEEAARAEIREVVAALGVEVDDDVLEDLADTDHVRKGLERALAKAGRTERVYACEDRYTATTALLVRHRLATRGPLAFFQSALAAPAPPPGPIFVSPQGAELGTLVELDPVDALGWIDLDRGVRVRFGGTSLAKLFCPAVGDRVLVSNIQPGFKGVPRAGFVGLAEPPQAAAPAPPPPPPIPFDAFVRAHPAWSDAASLAVPCARPAARPELEPHSLFEPWHASIVESAPTVVPLHVPTHRAESPIDPGPDDSFAHGRVAYLDQPTWPVCALCHKPLEMCVQIAPSVLADFVPGGRGLAVLFCFDCGVAQPRNPAVAHVALVERAHRVEGPTAWESRSSGWLARSQRVTAGEPVATIPSGSWHVLRGERAPSLASGALLGDAVASRLAGPFPRGFEREFLDDPQATFDDWIARRSDRRPAAPAGLPRPSAWLGGVPSWDQADLTPQCAHGERRQLLEYDGGQFLDGAIHVFVCARGACPLAFVAEF